MERALGPQRAMVAAPVIRKRRAERRPSKHAKRNLGLCVRRTVGKVTARVLVAKGNAAHLRSEDHLQIGFDKDWNSRALATRCQVHPRTARRSRVVVARAYVECMNAVVCSTIAEARADPPLAMFGATAWDEAKAPVKVPIVSPEFETPLYGGQNFEVMASKRVLFFVWSDRIARARVPSPPIPVMNTSSGTTHHALHGAGDC